MTATEIQAREERAAAGIAQGIYLIERIDADTWKVGYTDKAGKPVSYEVDTAEETCTCPDFAKHADEPWICKHKTMVATRQQEIAAFEAQLADTIRLPLPVLCRFATRLTKAEVKAKLGELLYDKLALVPLGVTDKLCRAGYKLKGINDRLITDGEKAAIEYLLGLA